MLRNPNHEFNYIRRAKDYPFLILVAEALCKGLSKDLRPIAMKWLQILSSTNQNDPMNFEQDVLELFLISLRSDILVEPFNKPPVKNDPKLLAKIVQNYRPSNITKSILINSMANAFSDSSGISHSKSTLKHNTKCYVLVQSILGFGGHYCYTYHDFDRNGVQEFYNNLPVGTSHVFPTECEIKKPIQTTEDVLTADSNYF